MELTQTLKGASLVIGLPILLNLLLWVSHAQYGGWLAVSVTLFSGVCLSLGFHRQTRTKVSGAGDSSLGAGTRLTR